MRLFSQLRTRGGTSRLKLNCLKSAWSSSLLSALNHACLAVQQDAFADLLRGLCALPLPLWVDVLRCRATLQAVARGNFARVAQTLTGAPPELWADILHSSGFTEAVAQDDPEQVAEALAGVPWCLWAGILDSSGACEAIVWRNLPELTTLLRRQGVGEQFWCNVLEISTPELYNAVFNGELAHRSNICCWWTVICVKLCAGCDFERSVRGINMRL
jgi:hypothetical protein